MSAPAGRLPDRGRAPAAPSWPRLPASFIAIALALVVAAALAGWVGRNLGAAEPAPRPAPPHTVDLGAVAASAPGAWAPARGAVPGLPDPGPHAALFAPVPGLSSRAVVALTPPAGRSLLPAGLRALAGTAAPRRVSLAGLSAWRYRAVQLAGGRMAQVTVAPTTAGSLTVVCVASAAAWSGAAGCANGLQAASLKGAAPLVPSPTLAFRRKLVRTMDGLGKRRAELRRRLRAARTGRGQARFAARLGRIHARAASVLAPLAVPGPPRRVVVTLRSAARGYGRLSGAALHGRPRAYRRARAAVRRSDKALGRTLARVR